MFAIYKLKYSFIFMTKLFYTLILFATIVVFTGCHEAKQEVELNSHYDSVSYSLGMLYAHKLPENLEENLIDSISYTLFVEGMKDFFNTQEENKISDETVVLITNAFQEKLQKKADSLFIDSHTVNIELGKAFLEQNKLVPGVSEIEPGLQHQVLSRGWGRQSPEHGDTVFVFYRVFSIENELLYDSRTESNQPVKIPLDSAVIAWQKVLPLYNTGGRTRIFTSHEFAYGTSYSEKLNIFPYSTLIFEVELQRFVRTNTEEQTQTPPPPQAEVRRSENPTPAPRQERTQTPPISEPEQNVQAQNQQSEELQDDTVRVEETQNQITDTIQ